jgi:hypothetical protein
LTSSDTHPAGPTADEQRVLGTRMDMLGWPIPFVVDRPEAAPVVARPALVCVDPVLLTFAEATAALYTFSDLADNHPHPTAAMVREEVAFLITQHGMSMIRRAAAWIAERGEGVPVTSPGDTAPFVACGCHERVPRLAWSRGQACQMFPADGAA